MTALEAALAVFDLSLALLVTAIAILGSRAPEPRTRDPLLLAQALHRARLQFAVLALAWTLGLVALLLAWLFQSAQSRLLTLILAVHAALLLLTLGFQASLYGPPTSVATPPPTPPQAEGPRE